MFRGSNLTLNSVNLTLNSKYVKPNPYYQWDILTLTLTYGLGRFDWKSEISVSYGNFSECIWNPVNRLRWTRIRHTCGWICCLCRCFFLFIRPIVYPCCFNNNCSFRALSRYSSSPAPSYYSAFASRRKLVALFRRKHELKKEEPNGYLQKLTVTTGTLYFRWEYIQKVFA